MSPYWEKWTDFEFDAMKKTVEAFNASQDRIQVDILSVSGIENKTLMAVAGGIPPDVAGLYGENVAQYADDHAVIQLDDLARENGITEDRYIPCFWDPGVIRGKLFSLPSAPATVALHYNTALLKKAGAHEAPTSTEEMDRLADRMTKRGTGGKLLVSGFLPYRAGMVELVLVPAVRRPAVGRRDAHHRERQVLGRGLRLGAGLRQTVRRERSSPPRRAASAASPRPRTAS